jgi:septal ring factor EnvC (AmiA/AmiB activator)
LVLLWGERAWSKGPDIQQQLQKEKKALEQIRQDLEEKRKGKRAVLKKEASTRSSLAETERRLRLRKKEVEQIARAIQKKDTERATLSETIRSLNQNIWKSHNTIARRLRRLYKEKVQGLPGIGPLFRDAIRGGSMQFEREARRALPDEGVRPLRGATQAPQISRRLYYLRRVAEEEKGILARLTQQRLQLREQASRLEDMSLTLKQERVSLDRAMAQMGEEKEKKGQLLVHIQDEKEFYVKAMLQLDESATQLQSLIRGLEERKNAVQKDVSDQKNVSGRFSKNKGRLGWPNDGRVVALFGRQKHPRFDAYVDRKGIEIDPSEKKAAGGEVRAVSDGVVIYADGFRGYDRVVIIDHGENYYSVYGHLTKLWVAVGDRVQTKRPIGEMGNAKAEDRLYFEIRHQGKPLDPIAWLKKRD